MSQLHSAKKRPPSAVTVVIHALAGDSVHMDRICALAKGLPDYRILVVAAPPPGGSASWFSSIAGISNIDVLRMEAELGRGAALRAGLGIVESPLIAFVDVEGDLPVKAIRQGVELLAADANIDAVFGSRLRARSRVHASAQRILLTRAFAIFAKGLFGLRCSDPQSPLKVFRNTHTRALFSSLRLFNHGFDVELAFRAQEAKLRIYEFPLDWGSFTRTALIQSRGPSAVASLIWLRMLASPLKALPGLDLLGRRFIIPVKEAYRILIFCWRDPYHPDAGGSEVYLSEQARAWVRQGHSVTWFAQSFSGGPRSVEIEGVKYVRRGRFPAVFAIAPFWYLLRSGRDYDFIIDCMNGIPFCSPLFSTKPKVCLVHHLHSHHFMAELPTPIGAIASAIETKLAPVIYRNTKFLTVSQSTCLELQQHQMTRLPISIVHNGVASSLRPGIKSSNPSILYFGRLKKYKRVRQLIRAFQVLQERIPDLTLEVAGTGDDEGPLRAYAESLGLAGIHFYGHVDELQKLELMQKAWVLGMPSEIEGWGIVVIEANACETPAVAFDVAGLRDCIVPGETGLLAANGEEFVAALEEVLTNGTVRAELSRNASKWAANFSWDATARRTLEQIRLAQPWRAIFDDSAVSGRQLRLGGSLRGMATLVEHI